MALLSVFLSLETEVTAYSYVTFDTLVAVPVLAALPSTAEARSDEGASIPAL